MTDSEDSSALADPTDSDSRTATGPRAGKMTLLIVFVIVFIDLLGFGIVLPLLPRYGAYFNANGMQLGLLMASFSAMQFLFAPMWGALSDRIGRRPVLIVGLTGSTFAYAMFGVATSLGREGRLLGLGALEWLFITRIAAGIAGATISTAQAVIADCTGVEGRGKGMALIGAAFGIGFTFGPLIGAASTSSVPIVRLSPAQYAAVKAWPETDVLLSKEDVLQQLQQLDTVATADREAVERMIPEPRPQREVKAALLTSPSPLPGYVAAALSGLALLLAFWRLPESRVASASASERTRGGFLALGNVRHYLFSAEFGVILVAIFITTFAFAQFESTLSLLTREFGYDSRQNFLLYAYIGAVLTVGQGLLVRRLLPRIGEYRMSLIGVFLMTAGFVLIALTGNRILSPSALWYILPVVTIGFSAVTPSLQSLLSQAASHDEQGAVLGTGQSLSSLARIAGPYIGIQLLDVSVATPYFAGAVLMLAGGVSIATIRNRREKPDPAPDAAQ